MYVDIITIVAAGFAAAGVALILNRLTGRRLPRWIVPAFAGGGMILMSLTNEYRWYPRTLTLLPSGYEVISTGDYSAPFSPWTYVLPYVNRFAAVDVAGVQRNANLPDLRLTNVVFFMRWQPVQMRTAVFDCAQGRSALIDGDVVFQDDGSIRVPRWDQTGPDDPATALVCQEPV
ncbi:hypothetical protein [Yoonia sp.]|uniref:hypothetical protein n=1 Tax=Yoonia sp. TaxID=2212373 RepID=UPI003A4DBAC0